MKIEYNSQGKWGAQPSFKHGRYFTQGDFLQTLSSVRGQACFSYHFCV